MDTDPRNLITQYTVDGLGNQSRLASPDTGITGQTVDAAGNVLTSTDVKGQLGTFTYDALNRVTGAVWSGSQTTPYSISYLYDEGENGAGRLTGVVAPQPTATTGTGVLRARSGLPTDAATPQHGPTMPQASWRASGTPPAA